MSDTGDSLLTDLRRVARGWRWTRRNLLMDTRDERPYDTTWARSPVARALREAALAATLGPLLRASLHVAIAGQEQLERVEAPLIFAANHTSHLDALLVLHALSPSWRSRTVVAAAADYFFDSWWRSTLSALALNAVPLARHAGGSANDELARLVGNGWSVLAFPEGSRSRDGGLQRFHHGVSRLALDTHRPVLPIAVRGTFAAMPVGARWPTAGRVRVRFGDPVAPAPTDRARDLTARIRAAVERTLREDATTWWSSLRPVDIDPPSTPVSRWRRVWHHTAPLPPDGPPPVWPR